MGPVGNGGLRLRHLGCADLPEPDGRIGRATAGRADAGIRSARTALRCRPAPPPVSGRRDGALRRLALRTDSASCGECRQRMALRMAAAARQRLGFAAARDDAGGRFGRFGQRHRFVRHLEHDLGLAGILPCDAREGPPQHRRLRRMLCPRGHPARNHSSNATARLALELVAKTTKGNTGGSGQSERLSRSARFIGQSGRFCRSYRLRRRSISKRDLQRNRSRTATVAAPAGR